MKIERLTLLLFGFCVGLLLCEGLLAWFRPQVTRRPDVWQFDALLGWAHIPGARGRMVGPEYDVEITINSAGLREREVALEGGKEVQRVLVFGDSFAEGWGVEESAMVSRKLEEHLNSRALAHKSVEVLNFGIAGFGTDQALLYFDAVGASYNPDVVLLLFYVNDLINNASRNGIGAERGFKPRFIIDRRGRLQLTAVPVVKSSYWNSIGSQDRSWMTRVDRYLYEHWHIYVPLRQAVVPMAVDNANRQRFYEMLYGSGMEHNIGKYWDLTGQLLASFRDRAVAERARFVVVYVPSIVQVEQDDWHSKQELFHLIGDFDLRRPNAELVHQADRHGIDLLDLTGTFVATTAMRTLYFRESHWNHAGHELAAAAIGNYLNSR